MRLGTRSLLWGCHQFILHPLFVLIAWYRLYGAPTPAQLLAIIVHDWGYYGCETMDGPDGSKHPLHPPNWVRGEARRQIIFHSRHLSTQMCRSPSMLCWADKHSLNLIPSVMWGVLAWMSGEGWEYMSNPSGCDYVDAEAFTLSGLIRYHAKFKGTYNEQTMRTMSRSDQVQNTHLFR